MKKTNKTNKSQISAAELISESETDNKYAVRLRQKQEDQKENIKNYMKVASPVLDDLRKIGFQINSVGELSQNKTAYRSAVPILLKWLPEISDPMVKEDIVRTLSVPWAKPEAAAPLIEEFKKAGGPAETGLRWAIANGLAAVADDSVFDEIARLAKGKGYGRDREMLVLALGNMKNPCAVPVLVELLDDEGMAGYAAIALGKLKAVDARSHIENLCNHPRTWIRNAAKKALVKIDKAISEQNRSAC